MPDGPIELGANFVQRVDVAELYMTHYAWFDEPDPGVPMAQYFDLATGAPTNELRLVPPVNQRRFHRGSPNPTDLIADSKDTGNPLPYIVSPPGFPPLPPPD